MNQYNEEPPHIDTVEERAREKLTAFFEERKDEAFYSRQVEVLYEGEFYHWITNRVIRDFIESGFLLSEERRLSTGGLIKIFWHKQNRYYRRRASKIISLVEEYAHPDILATLGQHGEMMVLEGFARSGFVLKGRDINVYDGRSWTRTEHDLDFIFEKDGVAYGVEVKNRLSYMPDREFKIKIALCHKIGVRPVSAVRMLPTIWIHELVQAGGYALILKYQLYPKAQKELVKRISREIGLPVGTPRVLMDGTMQRFLNWHEKNVN
jgi:hypothetical protein